MYVMQNIPEMRVRTSYNIIFFNVYTYIIIHIQVRKGVSGMIL